MGLNVSKGNMYGFVTHTWNVIKGKCEYDCVYCYMKVWGELKPPRFDHSELKTDLEEGNFIFIGSSIDMWADSISYTWIYDIMTYCQKFEDHNKFLIQSKNPKRFLEFIDVIPHNTYFCTTIETNRSTESISDAPPIYERVKYMRELKEMGLITMITIEPVLNFDVDELIDIIKICDPLYVNIGADSKKHNLPEPSKEKLLILLKELKKLSCATLYEKKNLNRLLK